MSRLLWVDLETSGDDERQDSILEVGYAVTDLDLNIIHPGRGMVIMQTDEVWSLRMIEVVREMHAKNGLTDDIRAGKGIPLHEAMAEVIDVIHKTMAEDGVMILAGSGVSHFDRRFLKVHMPFIMHYLKYYNIDIGAVRRFLRDIAGIDVDSIPGMTKARDLTHRAHDDVMSHIHEARATKIFLEDLCVTAGFGFPS